jgi:SAM-dependent methyltransferase
MKMLLSRTRKRLAFKVRSFMFDVGGFQSMIEQRDRNELEDSMGFRGQWDEHRRFQMAFLKEQGLLPQHRLLEIGCGPMTGGIPIIDYLDEGNYVGIDVRASVLDLAWKEVAKAALADKNPRLIRSSGFGAKELCDKTFDFVMSFSVLYHLNDGLLSDYFSVVKQRLAPDGVCFANVNTHIPSDKWLEFPFLRRSIDDYRRVAGANALATTSLGPIVDLGFRHHGMERENPMLAFRHQ